MNQDYRTGITIGVGTAGEGGGGGGGAGGGGRPPNNFGGGNTPFVALQ